MKVTGSTNSFNGGISIYLKKKVRTSTLNFFQSTNLMFVQPNLKTLIISYYTLCMSISLPDTKDSRR